MTDPATEEFAILLKIGVKVGARHLRCRVGAIHNGI